MLNTSTNQILYGDTTIYKSRKGDEQKVAFLTNKRLFKPKAMYFRLYNLLRIFQRMMDNIFRELLHEGVLTNYMDDFVILAKIKKKLEEKTIHFFEDYRKIQSLF